MTDNRPLAFMAWSTAIEGALMHGDTLDRVRSCAENVASGMRLTHAQLYEFASMFNWNEIDSRAWSIRRSRKSRAKGMTAEEFRMWMADYIDEIMAAAKQNEPRHVSDAAQPPTTSEPRS